VLFSSDIYVPSTTSNYNSKEEETQHKVYSYPWDTFLWKFWITMHALEVYTPCVIHSECVQ